MDHALSVAHPAWVNLAPLPDLNRRLSDLGSERIDQGGPLPSSRLGSPLHATFGTLVHPAGIEPATSSMSTRHSTTELRMRLVPATSVRSRSLLAAWPGFLRFGVPGS